MGLTADEATAGLRSWADGQQRFGYITEGEHDAVLGLLDEDGR